MIRSDEDPAKDPAKATILSHHGLFRFLRSSFALSNNPCKVTPGIFVILPPVKWNFQQFYLNHNIFFRGAQNNILSPSELYVIHSHMQQLCNGSRHAHFVLKTPKLWKTHPNWSPIDSYAFDRCKKSSAEAEKGYQAEIVPWPL